MTLAATDTQTFGTRQNINEMGGLQFNPLPLNTRSKKTSGRWIGYVVGAAMLAGAAGFVALSARDGAPIQPGADVQATAPAPVARQEVPIIPLATPEPTAMPEPVAVAPARLVAPPAARAAPVAKPRVVTRTAPITAPALVEPSTPPAATPPVATVVAPSVIEPAPTPAPLAIPSMAAPEPQGVTPPPFL